MTGGTTPRAGDAERRKPEFWDEAGALMKEIMDDFAFSKPIQVSLRDVQARIRYRLTQAAETRDAALREANAEIEGLRGEKRAPVQRFSAGIPWSMHLRAYDSYCKKFGPQPALIDLERRNCRGGFSDRELDDLIPGWRDELSEVAKLKAEIERERGASDRIAAGLNDEIQHLRRELGKRNSEIARLRAPQPELDIGKAVKEMWRRTRPSHEAQSIRSEVAFADSQISDWLDSDLGEIVCDFLDIAAQCGLNKRTAQPAPSPDATEAAREVLHRLRCWQNMFASGRGIDEPDVGIIAEAIERARAEEREACAKEARMYAAEGGHEDGSYKTALEIERRIRARTGAKP